MRARFSQSFKMQAVEKALSRSDVTSLKEVSGSLGVGHSVSLQRKAPYRLCFARGMVRPESIH